MTTILDQVQYKEQVVGQIRKVFPDAEHFSNEKESWVRVIHKEKEYNDRFSIIRDYMMYAIPPRDVALDMLYRLTIEILKDKQQGRSSNKSNAPKQWWL